jgi:hypothetical protein
VIEEVLQIAIDQRRETHLQHLLSQCGEASGLVPLRLGYEALSGQIRACGDLQLSIHSNYRDAPFQSHLQNSGRVADISAGLHYQICSIQQILGRVGQKIAPGKVLTIF